MPYILLYVIKGEIIDPYDIQKLQKLEVQTKEVEKRSRLFHLNLG